MKDWARALHLKLPFTHFLTCSFTPAFTRYLTCHVTCSLTPKLTCCFTLHFTYSSPSLIPVAMLAAPPLLLLSYCTILLLSSFTRIAALACKVSSVRFIAFTLTRIVLT